MVAVSGAARRLIDQVPVGEGRDLREVGDTDHLSSPGQPGESRADVQSRTATNPGVHLIEDEGGHRGAATDRRRLASPRRCSPSRAKHDLQREHHPGEFTSGG